MNAKSVLCGIVVLAIVSGCGVPQADFDKLKEQNEQLQTELEECQNGAEKLIAAIEKFYSEKAFVQARQSIEKLYEKHPESPKNEEFKKLLKIIEKEELIEKKREEAEEKERIRLENLNNTGIWSVHYYVDEFGEATKQGYIQNTNFIQGTFSNTATQNSKLNIKFLISNSSDISIQLYEYAGNNPVKAYSSDKYSVQVQDKDGSRLNLNAVNYSDRLSFDKTNSRKVHNALIKGGTVKFRIFETETPTTQYQFTIQKADWYDNAYKKLKES